MLKSDSFDGLFDLPLEFPVRHHAVFAGAGGGDDAVDSDASVFCGTRELDVQVVIDLVLVLEAAGCCARGAECG